MSCVVRTRRIVPGSVHKQNLLRTFLEQRVEHFLNISPDYSRGQFDFTYEYRYSYSQLCQEIGARRQERSVVTTRVDEMWHALFRRCVCLPGDG